MARNLTDNSEESDYACYVKCLTLNTYMSWMKQGRHKLPHKIGLPENAERTNQKSLEKTFVRLISNQSSGMYPTHSHIKVSHPTNKAYMDATT